MSGQRKATPSRATKKSSASRPAQGSTAKATSKPKPRPSKKTNKRKRSKLQIAGRILGWLSLLFLLMVLGGIGAFVYAYQHISIPSPNVAFQAQTSFVYYSDGKTPVGHFTTQDFQNRSDVSLADLPDSVKWAVLSAEDRSFETNAGVDPRGIIRATVNDVMGKNLQGASTITQQYVKILYLNQQRTISRKIQEGILALKINQQESKDQILQGYLNAIYFGRGAYGIQAASQAYFHTDASKLNVKQAAALAAIINDPTGLDPANGAQAEQALLGRYQYVLNGMVQMGNLDPAKADKYAAGLPKFPTEQNTNVNGGQAGHIIYMVRQQLLSMGFTADQIDTGGLRVVTTFDQKAMADAEKAVAHQRPKGKKFGDGRKKLHVAVASVEPGTGALRAMFAGQNFLKSQINWADVGDPVAQPGSYGVPSGSTFKPFSLAAGLKYGYSLQSQFYGNSPYRIGQLSFNNEGYNDYGKRVTLLRGLEESINTVYIDLVNSMSGGPQLVYDVATSLGIPPDAPGLNKTEVGITLGSASVSPIEMATAYAGFANHGVAAPWYDVERVTTADGEVLYQHKVSTHNAVPADVNADVTYALQQVVQHGTGTAARALGRPAGGKTGTATDNNNNVTSAWFVGFTPQLSTAVMYVRGDGNGRLDGWMPSYYGADFPARTWTAFMIRALKGEPVLSFPGPAHLLATRTDHPTPTPKPTPTETPTATDTATVTPTATDTATPTLPVPTTVTPLPSGSSPTTP